MEIQQDRWDFPVRSNSGNETGLIKSLLGSGIKENLVPRKAEKEEVSLTASGLFNKLCEVQKGPVKFTNLEVAVLTDLRICNGTKAISEDFNRMRTHMELMEEKPGFLTFKTNKLNKLLEERKTLILSEPEYVLEKGHFIPEIASISNNMEEGRAALLYAMLKKISSSALDSDVFSKLCRSSHKELGVYYKAFDFIGPQNHDKLKIVLNRIDAALAIVGYKHLDNKSFLRAGRKVLENNQESFAADDHIFIAGFSALAAGGITMLCVSHFSLTAAFVAGITVSAYTCWRVLNALQEFDWPWSKVFKGLSSTGVGVQVSAEPPLLEDKIFLDPTSLPKAIKNNSVAVPRIEEKIKDLSDSELKEPLEKLTQKKEDLLRTLKICGYDKLPPNLSRAFTLLDAIVQRHNLMLENNDEHAASYKAKILVSAETIHQHIEGLNSRLKSSIEREVFGNAHAINSILSSLDQDSARGDEA